MRAGRMRDRLKLQRPVTTTGADGVVVSSWHDVGTIYCQLIPIGSRESTFALDSISTQEQVEVVMRLLVYPDLTTECRFVSTDNAKVYEIAQCIKDNVRDQVWRCQCSRRQL